LDIVFAVDMFNEGLDIPSIDTVLMLRPTESSILWLQQFGRGLRKSSDKKILKVIDYIGNHRTFLVKLRSMLQPLLGVGESDAEIRRGLQILQGGQAQLPAGCSVTYELETIDLIESVLRPANRTEAMSGFYRDFEEEHDQRPTALEAYHAGYNPRALKSTHGTWFGYIDSMGGFDAEDRAAWEHQRSFFDTFEVTPMTKSYKMLVLLALLQSDPLQSDILSGETVQGGTGPLEIGISAIVQAVRRMAYRSAALRADLGEEHLESDSKLRRHMEVNPIDAWTKPDGAYFEYREGVFRWVGGELGPHRERFAGLLRELVDWRLAEYLDRGRPQEGHLCRIISAGGGRPIIKLPSRTGEANIPVDWVSVEMDGNAYMAKFAKQYINIVRETQESKKNVLSDILRSWHGPTVGQRGTRFEVQLVQDADGWHLRKA
jgi:hypothetical protein